MLPLRALFAAIFMVSLPFGLWSCSSAPPSSPDATTALRLALVTSGGDANNPPAIGKSYDCVIPVTHQPAPTASPFPDVNASCVWTVEEQGNVWLVSFSETWACDDWNASALNYPDCGSATGTHQWQYQVDLRDKTTQLITNRGQFAPDQH